MNRRVFACLFAIVTLFALAGSAQAAQDRDFTTRFAADEYGDIVLLGNQLMTCPAADTDCATALAGTNATRGRDNDFNMTYVDIDADGTTFDSSSSTLSMPAGSTVLFAGLYWSGDTSAGVVPSQGPTTTPTAAPSAAFANAAKFKAPGAGSYTTLTADAFDNWNSGTARYGAFKDVTATVQAAGNGTYTVANVQAGTGADRYAAWSLVVVYKGGSVERNLRVADGLKSVTSSAVSVSFSIGGLKVPTGTPAARLGIVSWEGDQITSGDTATFAGTALTDAINPANNTFNSSNSRSGTTFTAKSPNHVNQLGSDIDVFDITGVLAAGATSGSLSMTTSGDVYAPAVVATAIDRAPEKPTNEVAPTLSGTATDGQTLTINEGTWNGTPDIAYTYQWQRCDAAGASCVVIAGATAKTHTLTSADAGKTVRGVVNTSNSLGTGTATTAQTATIAAVAPANTADPAITGTTRVGQVLTTSNGTWSGTTPTTFAYQWQRCNAAGASCVDIAGATASTYTLVAADAGVTVRSKVTATNSAGAASDVSSASAVITMTPANTVVPTITGMPVAGNALTAAPGTWTGSPAPAYTYQWQRCTPSCANISGATASTYVVARADQDATLRVVVTGTNSAGSATGNSAQTATVTAAPLNTVLPAATGTLADGSTLTTSDGTWSGTTPMTYTYQWQRCNSSGASCVNIAGATAKTYTLTATDVGKTVRPVVTGTNATGTATANGTVSPVVVVSAPVNAVVPVLSGTPTVGGTLTLAGPGTWAGSPTITYTYAWERCDGATCTTIPGATGTSYTLTADDAGKTVRGRVTATNGIGTTTEATVPSAAVASGPANVTPPVISGTFQAGSTVTTTSGTWSGTPSPSFAYQWQRCDAAGANCADIPGATGANYTLTAADVGAKLKARVTASNSAGASAADETASDTVAPAPRTGPVLVSPPVVSGTAAPGERLTATHGEWESRGALEYTYQWQRCDAAGVCTDIAGANGPTYDVTDADDGYRIRVVVGARDDSGSEKAQGVAADAAAASVVTDLGGLTGSLVGPSACTTLMSTAVARSSVLPGTGKFKLNLKAASKQVTKTSPLNATLSGPVKKLRAIAITVDGKRVRGKAISPALIAPGNTHTIVAKLTPRKGTPRSVTMVLTTAKCGPVFTATAKRGARSRTLLLRVDSRWAVGTVSYKLTPALVKALRVAKTAGLQITGRGRHSIYKLGKNAALSGAGKPTVKLAGKAAVVSGLPAGTGIVTMTIPVKTAPRGRFSASATLAGGKVAPLKAAIGGKKKH